MLYNCYSFIFEEQLIQIDENKSLYTTKLFFRGEKIFSSNTLTFFQNFLPNKTRFEII